MAKGSRFDQRSQKVIGPQTNIAGGVKGSVFSRHFEIQGDFIYNEATKIRLPFYRPRKVEHFTGREDDLAALVDDLQPGRIVTVCGPGGMGKTALATEAIWQIAPENMPPKLFPDGIIFHTFYHRPQAALALETIARAYDVDPRPSPLEAAQRALSGRQALIVLDGAEACDYLGAVLSVTSSCGVLITTRRHSDAPADFKDLSPLSANESVQLLQAWGGRMASDVRTCQSICSLLGGLPLAIFLAGRYMSHRSQLAGEYLAWLEKTPLDALDLGKRQHESIPLLMNHSLAQVSDKARECLDVAGVLALQPFEPKIVAVALEIAPEDANRGLGELVDFGLLIRPDARYQMTHALAHTYARDRLAPPDSALARLAQYYEDLVRKQTELGSGGYIILDSQRDHILAVQSACNKARLWEAVRTITWAIEEYLDRQGHWVERIAVVQAGLEAARSDKNRYDEAAFLDLLGLAYADLSEPRKAIEYHEQALKISREIGDRRGEGADLGNLGLAYADMGEPEKAIEHYDQALAIAKEISDRRGEGADLGNLGNAYADLGEPRKAIEYYERALAIAREISDRRGEGNHLGNLGLAYADLGEPRKAIEHYDQALAIAREIGDRRGEGNHLGNLGGAYFVLGEPRKAIEHYDQALKISREIGDRRGEGADLGNLGVAYADLGEPRKAIDYYYQVLAIARKIGDRRVEASALFNMSLAQDSLANRSESVKLAREALAIYEQIESPEAERVRRKLAECQE